MSRGCLRLQAPAKINFGLRITGRRADGYHELESVFLPLDLCDELEVRVEPSSELCVELEVTGGDAPSGEENLAARAARAFLDAAGLARRVTLRLEKRIPVAAGLGGGSSDAGAVLRALAELEPQALEAARLRELALGLGADVPFFLNPVPSLVGGIGERCRPLGEPFPAWTLLLVHPGEGLSTQAVFEALEVAERGQPAPALASLLGPAASGSPEALDRLLVNDLEPAARRLCPAIGELQQGLRRAGARAVALSGSGATVYGVFDSPDQARRAGEAFPAPAWARVARTAEAR